MLVNVEWRAHLLDAGAVVQGDRIESFGDPQQEIQATATNDIVADLSSFSLVRVYGDDATTFLQGQLTNDIRLVDESHSQLSAYCNPKGRMLSVFRILMQDEHYLLQLPAPLLDTILTRLRMYVLRADVKLVSADEELQHIGVAGPKAVAIIDRQLGIVPDDDMACIAEGDLIVLRLPGIQPRFEIVTTLATAKRLWDGLGQDCRPVGTPAWAWLDIMAGLPNVYRETSEAFIPQMANLEILGGVSFGKGCYTGQEIVARMQYLGKLKQRMYRAHVFTTQQVPRPGDAIHTPDLPGQTVGTVVDARCSPESGYDMLAVIHKSSVQEGSLYLSGDQEARLSIEDLPYSLDDLVRQ